MAEQGGDRLTRTDGAMMGRDESKDAGMATAAADETLGTVKNMKGWIRDEPDGTGDWGRGQPGVR